MSDADFHPNRRLHYWYTGIAQWDEHSQWDLHRPCNCEGHLPNSPIHDKIPAPALSLGFIIVKNTLCTLSWSLGSAFIVICSCACFLYVSGELTCQVYAFSSSALNSEGQREEKSSPRHMNMKPQYWQPGVEMFFISFSICSAFQGPSWWRFRCGMAAKRLWSILGEHVWYSPSCSSPQSWQAFFGPLAKAVLQCRCWQAVPAGWLEDTVKTDPLNGLQLQGSTYPCLYC